MPNNCSSVQVPNGTLYLGYPIRNYRVRFSFFIQSPKCPASTSSASSQSQQLSPKLFSVSSSLSNVSSSVQPALSVPQHTHERSQPMDEEDASTSAVCGGAQDIGESLSCLGQGLGGGLAHKSADIGTVRLKFASWNMGGFYGNNTKLECISKIGADIVCLTETHLCDNESNINLPGYMWFGHNRKSVHKKAWRGSGGVGVLVANYVLESFSVNILSKDFEDILRISLVHTATAETFGVCVAYLPPSNSSRGDKSLEFVNIMRMLVLKLHSFDNFMICGDFNARCSDKPDTQTLDQCDNIIPTRLSIDHSPVNSHHRRRKQI